MPPKAQTSTRRGRPARAAAVEAAAPDATMSTSSTLKKRGRPAKADTVAEPPKKRGRPARTPADEPIAQIDSAIKRGRRSVAAAQEAVAEASVSTKKRAGRPRKDAAPEASATPKRRGRPALDIGRFAGSPRVTKRTSQKPVARGPAKVAAPPRINAKMRSRLRQRTAPVEKLKTEIEQPVKKGRGRPKKVNVEPAAAAPKKTVGRGRKPSAPIPAASAKKITARPKTAAPRKRRGYTAFEVPDKFAAQVKNYITELQAEDAANAAAAAGEADDEGEDLEIEVELGPEEGATGPSEEAATPELTEDDELEGDNMLVDPVDGAIDVAVDEEELVSEEQDATEPASDIDDLDETELPSETAVLAEIAAVQDKLNVQDAIQDDVQMAEISHSGPERDISPDNISVDLHADITEVTSLPQADGTNEVEVFHAHIDEHEHIHQPAHASEPAPATTAGSLFGRL